jgi:hypothetical protein
MDVGTELFIVGIFIPSLKENFCTLLSKLKKSNETTLERIIGLYVND